MATKKTKRRYAVAVAFHSECCPHVHAEVFFVQAMSVAAARKRATEALEVKGIEVFSEVSVSVRAVPK